MHLIFIDITNNFLPALSWTLIHSLWQGMLLSVFAGLIILLTKRTSSSIRYLLFCLLFFSFIGMVFFTFMQELMSGSRHNSDNLLSLTNGSSSYSFFHHPSVYNLLERSAHFVNANSILIVTIWLIILCVKLFRITFGLMYSYRIRHRHIFQPDNYWVAKVQRFCNELGIHRKVSIFESALIKVPVVVGHFKPVILIPLGILSNLAPGQVEAVLLHELAHIRRNDYIINFAQNIAGSLFFFNPGLLWISSLIRAERENCCDDIAISKTGNKLQFIEALISFKEYSIRSSEYMVAFPGKKNLLLQRAARIIQNKNKGLNLREVLFFIAGLLSCSLLVSTITKPAEISDSIKPRPTAANYTVIIKQQAPATNKQFDVKLPTKKQSQKLSDRRIRQEAMNKMDEIREFTNDDRHTETNAREQNNSLGETIVLKEKAESDRHEADAERERAEHDREKADHARTQADDDREIAVLEKEKSIRNAVRAEKDRRQAGKDRERMHRTRERARTHNQPD